MAPELTLHIVSVHLPLAEAARGADGAGQSAGSSEPAGRHREVSTPRLSLLECHAVAEPHVRRAGTRASRLACRAACLSCLASLAWGSRKGREIKALSSDWGLT